MGREFCFAVQTFFHGAYKCLCLSIWFCICTFNFTNSLFFYISFANFNLFTRSLVNCSLGFWPPTWPDFWICTSSSSWLPEPLLSLSHCTRCVPHYRIAASWLQQHIIDSPNLATEFSWRLLPYPSWLCETVHCWKDSSQASDPFSWKDLLSKPQWEESQRER